MFIIKVVMLKLHEGVILQCSKLQMILTCQLRLVATFAIKG